MNPQTRSLRIGFATFTLAAALAMTAGQATAELAPQPVASSGSTGTGSGSYFLDRLAAYLTSGSSSCPPWALICGPIG
ncbi:hypothetical protein [Nocardia sp. NBC_01327]|uniref:hypothetical protein n=1 Tax=Nocardia sp. NBC_01327 TaxID=2903593 RepID=UPI002E100212|nr:hypothetical protein OG326_12630 [Nocardia sp. NBC_01327]